jgi:4-hydroxybutyrate dehydrogenase / sulfolactaldehyde 3-reductase
MKAKYYDAHVKEDSMVTRSERIGFIGLGSMGRPMATSLVRKEFAISVYDAVATQTDVLVERGAARASDVTALISSADVVITMLPNTPDVSSVVSGPGGLVETGSAGMLMIDMSTIDPAASRSFGVLLEKRGIRFIDAAVGRSPAHAERGESLFMVGAEAGDLERARPILEAMGNKIIHCGPQGSGIAMKIVNNFLAMATCQISAEALTLGSKLGLSMATMYDVITSSLASNDHLKTYWPTKVLNGDVEPGFAIDLAYKDLSIGVSAAAAASVPVFAGAAARECLAQARAGQGLGGKDITAVLLAAAANAGIEAPRL